MPVKSAKAKKYRKFRLVKRKGERARRKEKEKEKEKEKQKEKDKEKNKACASSWVGADYARKRYLETK